jgi:hypothetical protein
VNEVVSGKAIRRLPSVPLSWLLCLACLVVVSCGGSRASSGPAPRQQAIRQAYALYEKAKARGMNFSRGPCISNGKDIVGWVVDIAHRPRQPVDDLPQNQCSAFIDGKVDHFVELDPRGRLIRTGP